MRSAARLERVQIDSRPLTLPATVPDLTRVFYLGLNVVGERLGGQHSVGMLLKHSTLHDSEEQTVKNATAFAPGTDLFASLLKHEVLAA